MVSIITTAISTIRIRNAASRHSSTRSFRKIETDAPGADNSDDGCRAGVGHEEVQRLAGEYRQHLGQQAEADGGEAPAATGEHALNRSCLGVSIASDISLARPARSVDAMANAPANGPSPTTLIQIVPDQVSTLRTQSSPRRVMKCTTRPVTTFRAARKPSGKAITAAAAVPRNAIARDCPNAPR